MQVLPAFCGARVMGLLDGSDSAPAKTLEVEAESTRTTVSNPAYEAWIERDQQVVSYLTKSISKDVLAQFFALDHAAEIWAAIEASFASQSKARINMLRGKLVNTKKRDMPADIALMKSFASELAAAGRLIDDDEIK